MSGMTPELHAKMLRDTQDAAAAFLEDLSHMRQTLTVASSRRDCRHISAILRRLLVDDDLRAIAAPRVGRVKIVARSTDAFYRGCEGKPLAMFASGGRVFGSVFSSIMFWPKDFDPPKQFPGDSATPVAMSVDAFLSQKVLALDGAWASRREVIKYIANSKSGVHSASDDPATHTLLSRLELSATYTLGGPGGMPLMKFHDTDKLPPIVSATYVRDALNPVLAEIFAAAFLLVTAPDVLGLESVLQKELA